MQSKLVFQMCNRKALFLWGFMVFWFGMLSIFIYLIAVNGAPKELGNWMPVILVISIIVGSGAARWAFNHPVVFLKIDGSHAEVSQLFIFKREKMICLTNEIFLEQVVVDKDSEGDPYYKLAIVAKGVKFIVYESHSIEAVKTKYKSLQIAIQQAL